MTDWIDKLLAAGSIFDYFTPVVNELTGHNRGVIQTRNYEEAIACQIDLKKRGIKSRVEGTPISGYSVVTK